MSKQIRSTEQNASCTGFISGRIAATIKSSFGFDSRNHVAEKRKIFSEIMLQKILFQR
uniref:Uncharacterized protein n=1 Tax=Citrus limon TaxID=2708 RepID=A0A1S8AC03_CITLI